jgi:hypothetical protein
MKNRDKLPISSKKDLKDGMMKKLKLYFLNFRP